MIYVSGVLLPHCDNVDRYPMKGDRNRDSTGADV
jgi:hypothetical protein